MFFLLVCLKKKEIMVVYKDKEDQSNKIKFNKLNSKYLKEILKDKNNYEYFHNPYAKHIILDSKLLNTTKMLLQNNIDINQIISVENTYTTYLEHRNYGIQSYYQDLKEFLSNKNQYGNIDSLILDMCGCISKNQDIAFLALNNGYINHNTLLVLTFSKRGRLGDRHSILTEEFISDLTIKSKEKGFNLIEKPRFEYGGWKKYKIVDKNKKIIIKKKFHHYMSSFYFIFKQI